jgi:hemoglobin-like flavoprotein
LFGDMTARKLMTTLAVVVNGLSNLETILPAASTLAKRHVHYGVKADHYQPVGAALMIADASAARPSQVVTQLGVILG